MAFHFGPQLFRIRKTAWIASALVLAYLAHSLWIQLSAPSVAPGPSSDSVDSDTVSLVVCAGLVDGLPFRVDSNFVAVRDRVHAYTKSVRKAELSHIWFREGTRVAQFSCLYGKPCESSLATDSLPAGQWSIDFVSGRTLLASRQFRVTP